MPMDLNEAEVGALVGAVGLLAGWAVAASLRRADHRTFVLARAPKLPIAALCAHDDAWITGKALADRPLLCPHFDVPCVAYEYRRERLVTKTRRVTDSDGKTRTVTEQVWETEDSDDKEIAFWLDDGQRVLVQLPEGDNEAMSQLGYDYQTSKLRHSASVLRVGATVHVLGVLRDDQTFGPLQQVPLLVTDRTREQAVSDAHGHEGCLFLLAQWLPFLGVGVGVGIAQQAERAEQWAMAGAYALPLLVLQWWILTNNRLVRLRQQTAAAEKQVDLELKMRADLVPNLVAVVQAAAAHEQELLQGLARLRTMQGLSERIGHESQAVSLTRRILLLHEDSPDLKSDANYRALHERLWAIEEKIAHARTFYNETVTEWNRRVEQFPSMLVAKARAESTRPLFEADCEERLPPRLS